ncbi:MAG: LytS/YhcK type 5TM receptor domain-containing protein [Bacillus sp. (in: firmicutes)]
MFQLAPAMIEKVGIIVIVAFLISKMKPFRQIVQEEHTNIEKVKLIVLFGAFGVISNYTAIEVNHNDFSNGNWLTWLDDESALANTRVMGIVIGGLMGGPAVGFGAGLIAGMHRYTLGGFTALSCGVSTVLAGCVAGYLGHIRKKKGKQITPSFAVAVGMTLEAVQMLIILLVARPFEWAWELVQFISLPMIFINGLGTLLFMFILSAIKREQESARANQTNLAFHIAELTLPYFRQGLNECSSREIANIILDLTEADAVAITDENSVLAHVGAGSDHHVTADKPVTGLTGKVLASGRIAVAKSKRDIYCPHDNCPLEAAVVLPLKVKKETVGTLKMYYTNPRKLDRVQRELAEGLAGLFSIQVELAEAEHQARLRKDAEIKALHAQIHPHFLFNSMNTISALCRTDPEKARSLLLELSSFFRGNLKGARQRVVPLRDELDNVRAYLSIVQTRFPGKYNVHFNVDAGLKELEIPPFTLQPIVENAIHYGFPGSKDKGNIWIRIHSKDGSLLIVVEDDGVGMPEERRETLGEQEVESLKGSGTALFNIRERLKGIYHGEASMTIWSEKNKGTVVSMMIPCRDKGADTVNVKSVYSG